MSTLTTDPVLTTPKAAVESFIGDGVVLTDFGHWDISAAVIQQADGQLVISGYSSNSFALARYNRDGSLDTSFNRDGKVISDFGWAGGFYGGVVAQQSDGDLVVAGRGYNGTNFELVRYNSDGSLDSKFGEDGKVSTNFGSYTALDTTLVIQTDGKVVAAGTIGGFALARYNKDGSFDSSFSDDGKASLRVFNGYIDNAQAIIQQADGKLVVSGYSRGTTDTAALLRFNKDGSLDTSFSGDGGVLSFFTGSSHAASVVQQDDGKLVVAGNSNGDFALTRFNSDGSIDKSFNSGSVVLTDFKRVEDSANDVALQADGKIVVAGRSNGDFALARYNLDGSLDRSFDSDGLVTTDLGASDDNATSVLIQSDGDIVVTGSSGGNFAMARYNLDGSLDTRLNNLPTGEVRISGLNIDNLSPTQGQTLVASNDLDDADGLGAISYQWRSGDTVLANGAFYTLKASDVDTTIHVVASYTDGLGSLEQVSSEVTQPVLPVGISIEDASGNNITDESGSTAKYEVVLTGQPTKDVVINFSSTDTTEGVLEDSVLTFTSDNWDSPQTLVVAGVNDYVNDGDISYSVTGTIRTADANFSALTINRINLINEDDGRDSPLKIVGKLNAANNLIGLDGADSLIGGNLSDIMSGGIGTDNLFGGKGDDQLFGGEDNDKLSGDQGSDSLDGGTGDDTLNGGSEDDSLSGSDGNDSLIGGDGSDKLIGGSGNDVYYIGYDANFKPNDTVIDDDSSGDVDTIIMPYQIGSYSIPKDIKNCSITTGLTGSVAGNDLDNKIVGNDGNNVLNGNNGNDVLLGGVGNDQLTGGVGADRLYGGAGNDVYAVDDRGDSVIEAAPTTTTSVSNDNDTVNSYISSYKLPAYTENLKLMTGAFIGTGNELNNTITGNTEANTLVGGTGIDTMAGGAGGDTYYVDSIYDVIREEPTITIPVSAKNALHTTVISWDDPLPPPIDTANSSVSYTLPPNVENLTLSGSAAVKGTGNELNNVLTGNTGNNELNGLSGNDTLIGNAGNDTLDGGDDSDVMTGGTGNDVFMFANVFNSTTRETITDMNNGNDTIYLQNSLYTKLTVTGALNAAKFISNATGTPAASDDYLIYNTSTGILTYDSNGNGSGGATKIALIGTSTHPALTAADFFVL